MPTTKRIVCLANSRKHSGRCIAGKELGTGQWIRPVSARASEEVSEKERQYPNGGDPQVLDLIDVPLLEPRPAGCQRENWLLDPRAYWRPVGHWKWNTLMQLLDEPGTLWINGSSTSAGRNDRVGEVESDSCGSSLFLIRVPRLKLSVYAPGARFENPKRRVQASFLYRDVDYSMWVTDPRIEREFLAREDGEYPLGECCLVVSLGEPHQGFRYKLVAAVIASEQAGAQ